MTEKQLFRRLMKHTGIALLVFLLISIGMNHMSSRNLIETFDGIRSAGISHRIYSADNMVADIENPDILTVDMFDKEYYVYSNITGLQEGETSVEYRIKDTDEYVYTMQYKVLSNHTVIDLNSGNFSNWEQQRILVLTLMIAVTVLLWESFYTAQKRTGYSYHAIFCSGFGIWMVLADSLVFNLILYGGNMNHLYLALFRSAGEFLVNTAVPLLIFAVVLTISNLSLIRREGFRPANALGIGISGMIIVGIVIYAFLYYRTGSPGFESSLYDAENGSFAAVYSLFECFLLGSVLNGTLAAGHEPSYDKDYIIILGCGIRKDGTLYPLIKGRVDRAIAFYKKQLEKTGKKAVFVPSGGKGSDEPIAEAEAMKRYLLEQGFTEEDILAENRSLNTKENMRFSKKLIDERTPDAKIAYSTTNYHVFRSGIISREEGVMADGMGAKTKWYFWPNAYIREMIGMITYCWKSLAIQIVLLVIFFSFLAFR